jgi:ubiquinone/menaquinone biosynthesis C-methylase UbiE
MSGGQDHLSSASELIYYLFVMYESIPIWVISSEDHQRLQAGSEAASDGTQSTRQATMGFLPWLAVKALSTSYGLLYRQLSPVYDLASWVVSGGRWREWQRAALDEIPLGRVLEVGPGPGHFLLDLVDSGRDAYGLELSPEMLLISGRRLGARGHSGRLVAGDARRLPFAEAAFDGIVSTFPAPFLDAAFWEEAARVLRPGGRLVLVLGAESRRWPWPGALEWILSRLAGRAAGGADGEGELAPGLTGRFVERAAHKGVVRLLLAERR